LDALGPKVVDCVRAAELDRNQMVDFVSRPRFPRQVITGKYFLLHRNGYAAALFLTRRDPSRRELGIRKKLLLRGNCGLKEKQSSEEQVHAPVS